MINRNAGADDDSRGVPAPLSFEQLEHVVEIRLPSLTVDDRLLQVRYACEVHNVTWEQARLLKALIDANGDWVSASSLGITKASEVKNQLPNALRDLIESSPGKGYRLKRIERR